MSADDIDEDGMIALVAAVYGSRCHTTHEADSECAACDEAGKSCRNPCYYCGTKPRSNKSDRRFGMRVRTDTQAAAVLSSGVMPNHE